MITYDETLAKLTEIVASKPADYRYVTDPAAVQTAKDRGETDWVVVDDGTEYVEACYYRHSNGNPGCIVGQFISLYNPDFVVTEGQDSTAVLPEAGLDVDEWAQRLLRNIQMHQDNGSTWSQALKSATNAN